MDSLKLNLSLALSLLLLLSLGQMEPLRACSSVLVTKGASADGSCMITYAADSAGFYVWLDILPACDGAIRPADRSAYIPDALPTCKVLGFYALTRVKGFQGIMNEYQVAITETTFEGPSELQNKVGSLEYTELITITLQQARTARQAVEIMIREIEEHGYIDLGESFSICDPNEVWVFEIVGTGSTDPKKDTGSVWVALKVPDGHITAHANQARIRDFPRNDPENCLYAPNVESFAIETGRYDPKSGKPFSFEAAYGGIDDTSKRACEKRVWSFFRRAAPSLNLSDDYAQGVPGAELYPWSIVPDKKLSVSDVMALTRDRYDGTPYDMRTGIDAGPYGNPVRNRPLTWKVDDVRYAWERPISAPQTCCTILTQSRSGLPNEIGGLTWFGWDDAYTSCYFPLYMGMSEIPDCCRTGNVDRFDPDSSWWIFNFVANYAYGRFSEIYPDIQKVQQELESHFLKLQPAIEKTALSLSKTDPELMRAYLNDYSNSGILKVHNRWSKLAGDMIAKFNDGYIRSPSGRYPNVGYPETWLRKVIQEKGDQFRLPPKEKASQ
ncbi:MAG: hypothetical protein EOM12_07745 [Verrucomicrobiae bacterium]|nr:hypothetical protein [Verrucomicrobiae bacterium]